VRPLPGGDRGQGLDQIGSEALREWFGTNGKREPGLQRVCRCGSFEARPTYRSQGQEALEQHPNPAVRRAVRVLSMVGELHKRGFQKVRIMPMMAPSGVHWRCLIGPATLFYRNNGAMLQVSGSADEDDQSHALVARYTTGSENRYFDWTDAQKDNARQLADKFLERFSAIASSGAGHDYPYAGWYQHLLGLAERSWMPIVVCDWDIPRDRVTLLDQRPPEWHNDGTRDHPFLPLPPPGELPLDYSS
jgi:hypothetical protein